MKTLLILSVLFSGLLAATTAPAVEAAPEELPADSQVAVEVGVPVGQEEEPEIEMISPEEEVSSPEGRFFFCPHGWEKYKDGCYTYVRSSTSWSGAVASCKRLGSTLAPVLDFFDYSFLQSLTRRGGASTAWIGGFFFQGWRWVDQSPFSYTNWHILSSSSSNPCIYLNSGVGWSNAHCGGARPYICKKKIGDC